MTTILMKSDAARAALWKQIFNDRAPEIDFRTWPEIGDADDVTCLLTWDVPAKIREQFPNLEIVYAIGAGVDHIDPSSIPRDVHLVRMVEPGIQTSMNEWVLMAVLSAHRQLVGYIDQQQRAVWKEIPVVNARLRRVGNHGGRRVGRRCIGCSQASRIPAANVEPVAQADCRCRVFCRP